MGQAHSPEPAAPDVKRLAEAGKRHYHDARVWRSRWEAIDSLTRAVAAFRSARRAALDGAGGVPPDWVTQCEAAVAFVEDVRRQVEGGGLDELPPLPEALKLSPTRSCRPAGRG
jgi:hypothetical protein